MMNDEERLFWGKYLSAVATSRRQELEALDELLNDLGKPIMDVTPKAQQPTLEELNSLKYSDTLNRKNEPYEMTSRSDNQNNATFKKVQSYIQDHGGFVNLHGFKIWVFRDNPDLLGRKPIEKTQKASKPVVEKPKVEKKSKPEQPASLISYDDSKINYVKKDLKYGPNLLAFKDQNENNPDFDSQLQSLKTRKANGEKISPYWIFTDGNGFGKNITKKA